MQTEQKKGTTNSAEEAASPTQAQDSPGAVKGAALTVDCSAAEAASTENTTKEAAGSDPASTPKASAADVVRMAELLIGFESVTTYRVEHNNTRSMLSTGPLQVCPQPIVLSQFSNAACCNCSLVAFGCGRAELRRILVMWRLSVPPCG